MKIDDNCFHVTFLQNFTSLRTNDDNIHITFPDILKCGKSATDILESFNEEEQPLKLKL